MRLKKFKYLLSLVVAASCATTAFAHYGKANYKDDYKGEAPVHHPWCLSNIYVGAAGGYGVFDGAHNKEGTTAFGRLSLGAYVADFQWAAIGLETGVQSGNIMAVYDNVDFTAGGLEPQVVVKPTLDLLVTVKGKFSLDWPVTLFAKGGIAYREMQFIDRTSDSHDHIRNVSGEFQGGIGYNVSRHAMIVAYYQGIYSNNCVGYHTDATGDNSYLRYIPTEQAGFLGVEYTF